MKTTYRLFLAIVALAILNVAVVAQDYSYTTNNGTITITKYTGPGGAVTIPEIITGLPVTSIGDWFCEAGGHSFGFHANESVAFMGIIAPPWL